MSDQQSAVSSQQSGTSGEDVTFGAVLRLGVDEVDHARRTVRARERADS
jgi:hypothetical protein